MAESSAKMRPTALGSPANAARTPFWKKNSSKVPGSVKPVYGAQHPPLMQPAASPTKNVSGTKTAQARQKKQSSFDAFKNRTNDAWEESDPWDVGEPDDVELSDSEEVKLSPQSRHPVLTGLAGVSDEARERVGSGRAAQSGDKQKRSGSGRGSGSQHSGTGTSELPDRDTIRLQKFERLLKGPNTELEELKKLAWGGIPVTVRPTTWKLLSGYLPANVEWRQSTLERKRKEYERFVSQYYKTRLDPQYEGTFRQIAIDIPRMKPSDFFQQKIIQECFERVLYIWAMRHPASGYVQGINDLLTPFYFVFLSEHIESADIVVDYDVSTLSQDTLAAIEADAYGCMSRLLEGIQDNYTFAQPGIQMKVNSMKEIVRRVDAALHKHIASNSIDYLQFSFRWFNNILRRELPLRCVIRLWDTYQSEVNGFGNFHLYVCAAFLIHFSKELKAKKDFQSLLLFLQCLPTSDWTDDDISVLLSEAFQLKYMFADAPSHLHSSSP